MVSVWAAGKVQEAAGSVLEAAGSQAAGEDSRACLHNNHIAT